MNGITADSDKTAAIQEMQTPTNVSKLQRFMGMVNQMGKFSTNLLRSPYVSSLARSRILRFQLRLDRFDYSIVHVQGNYICAHRRQPLWSPLHIEGDSRLTELAELAMDACISHLPAQAKKDSGSKRERPEFRSRLLTGHQILL